MWANLKFFLRDSQYHLKPPLPGAHLFKGSREGRRLGIALYKPGACLETPRDRGPLKNRKRNISPGVFGRDGGISPRGEMSTNPHGSFVCHPSFEGPFYRPPLGKTRVYVGRARKGVASFLFRGRPPPLETSRVLNHLRGGGGPTFCVVD